MQQSLRDRARTVMLGVGKAVHTYKFYKVLLSSNLRFFPAAL